MACDCWIRHDALVRLAAERHSGRMVKGTGDGVLATFDGPARAVRFATDVDRELGALGIKVRARVHTGEVEVRGEDIAGIAVHIAARIAAMASEGEVLASRTVKDLTAGAGLEFADRGSAHAQGRAGRLADLRGDHRERAHHLGEP